MSVIYKSEANLVQRAMKNAYSICNRAACNSGNLHATTYRSELESSGSLKVSTGIRVTGKVSSGISRRNGIAGNLVRKLGRMGIQCFLRHPGHCKSFLGHLRRNGIAGKLVRELGRMCIQCFLRRSTGLKQLLLPQASGSWKVSSGISGRKGSACNLVRKTGSHGWPMLPQLVDRAQAAPVTSGPVRTLIPQASTGNSRKGSVCNLMRNWVAWFSKLPQTVDRAQAAPATSGLDVLLVALNHGHRGWR